MDIILELVVFSLAVSVAWNLTVLIRTVVRDLRERRGLKDYKNNNHNKDQNNE